MGGTNETVQTNLVNSSGSSGRVFIDFVKGFFSKYLASATSIFKMAVNIPCGFGTVILRYLALYVYALPYGGVALYTEMVTHLPTKSGNV